MKIPRELPQFEEDKVLLAATSKKEADIYLAGNGEILKLGTVSVQPPQYSDREGFFMRRGKGHVFGSGSVYEKKKEKVEHEFVPVFSKTLLEMCEHYEANSIYLFSPAYQVQYIYSALPQTLIKNIRMVIKNNFFNRHPFKLLNKIRLAEENPPLAPTNPEVISILQRKNIRPSFSI